MATGINRRVFLATAGSAVLTACAAGDGPLSPAASAPADGAFLLSPPFRVTIDGPKSPITVGMRCDITGTVFDPAGLRAPYATVGIEDGLRGRSISMRTDAYGKFRYSTTPDFARTAVVTLVVQDQRFPFAFQAVRKIGTRAAADSAQIRQLVYNNTGPKSLKVTLIGPTGARRVFTIAPRKATLLLADAAALLTRVTPYGGYVFDAGPLNAAGTFDATGVLTLSGTGGEGPFRAKLYATSSGDIATSWVPGTGAGTAPLVTVSGDVDICLGTTGFRLGAPSGPRTPNVLGDVSIQIG